MRTDTVVSTEALAVAGRLRPVILRLNRRLRKQLRNLDITGIQISLLAAIRNNPGIGQSDLAAREEMSPAALSIHVDRLEAAGWVERTRGEAGDRRRVGLRSTPAGEDLLETVRARRTEWLAEGLSALTPEDLALIDSAIEPLQRLLDVGP